MATGLFRFFGEFGSTGRSAFQAPWRIQAFGSEVWATSRVSWISTNVDARPRPWALAPELGYDYRTSVDNIEAATGLDFFNGLPVALQASLEAGVDAGVVH